MIDVIVSYKEGPIWSFLVFEMYTVLDDRVNVVRRGSCFTDFECIDTLTCTQASLWVQSMVILCQDSRPSYYEANCVFDRKTCTTIIGISIYIISSTTNLENVFTLHSLYYIQITV